jgi:hypothetical protein
VAAGTGPIHIALMHLSLSDLLTCPRCGPGWGLVLLPGEVRERRVETGVLGVCYYPEHWPESWWEDDARRMRELEIAYVRIGEFAWSRLEAEPGELLVQLALVLLFF